MGEEKSLAKEGARRALIRGEWGKALQYLQEHCAGDPKDLQSRQKVAELLERLGRTSRGLLETGRQAHDSPTLLNSPRGNSLVIFSLIHLKQSTGDE